MSFLTPAILFAFVGIVVGPLSSSIASADPFNPHNGWTCLGSSPEQSYVNADVLFMSMQGGQAHYRVRVITSKDGTGKNPSIATTVENVLEQETADAYIYADTNTQARLNLTIRKVEGSEQGLRSTLKASGVDGTVNLLCNRTR